MAANESLEVAQTERAWFVTVSGEDLGVLHEFFESHASLPDARFKQCPWRPIGQPVTSLGMASLCRADGTHETFR